MISLILTQSLLVSLTFRGNHMKFILSSSKFAKLAFRMSILLCAHIQICFDIFPQLVAFIPFKPLVYYLMLQYASYSFTKGIIEQSL